MDNPNSYLAFAILAVFVGALAVYNKLSNDVVAFDKLVSVCSQDVEKVNVEPGGKGFWSRWRYEKVKLLIPEIGEAVLHGNTPGYLAAASAIIAKENYCFSFDPKGRTRSVYQVTVDGRMVMNYSAVARDRKMNVDGIFWIGIGLIFVVGPYQLSRFFKLRRKQS